MLLFSKVWPWYGDRVLASMYCSLGGPSSVAVHVMYTHRAVHRLAACGAGPARLALTCSVPCSPNLCQGLASTPPSMPATVLEMDQKPHWDPTDGIGGVALPTHFRPSQFQIQIRRDKIFTVLNPLASTWLKGELVRSPTGIAPLRRDTKRKRERECVCVAGIKKRSKSPAPVHHHQRHSKRNT